MAITKGTRSEISVHNILQRFKAKGIITDFCPVRPKDTPGYDFTVSLPGRKVLVQVKSSEDGSKHHNRKYPDIPCVVVPRHPLYRTNRIQFNQILEGRILEALGLGKETNNAKGRP